MKLKNLILSATAVVASAFILSSCGQKNTEATTAEEQTIEETTAAAAPTASNPVIVLAKGETITPAEGKGVVIDFNATWCGPCKQFHPNFEAVAAKNLNKADFYSVDIDVHPELAARYNVTSIPTVAYVTPDGKVNTTVGYLTAEDFADAVSTYIP